MDYILQKEYDNLEKVLYQFNTLIDDVKALEREIQVLERQGAPAAILPAPPNAPAAITPALTPICFVRGWRYYWDGMKCCLRQ